VRQIIKNAVRWAAPTYRIEKIECPHIKPSPEELYAQKEAEKAE